jgi:hypothetical protein
MRPLRAGLDGPSRTIIVEPVEAPATLPAPQEEPTAPPEHTPAPEREPEEIPA